MDIVEMLQTADEKVWLVVLILLVAMGLYLTVRLKFFQVTFFREMARCSLKRKDDGNKHSVSQFQAFCVAVGQHIGVGNISGPILAILMGGPGQIFWMWIFTFIGMAPTFIESAIGQLFKEREGEGYKGGLTYYIRTGAKSRKLGLMVAVLMVLTYGIGFVSVQQSSAQMAFDSVFHFDNNKIIFAVAITQVIGLCICHGAKSVIRMMSKFVPVMAVSWIAVCIITVILIPGGAATAFGSIFAYALNLPAVLGGGLGTILAVGMQRGIFQNEAGLGTIPTLSSMADVKHPAKSGLAQQFGVTVDIVICTLSALTVLSIGSFDYIYSLGLESVPLIIHVFGTLYGDLARYIIIIFLTVFQISCTLQVLVNQTINLHSLTDRKEQKSALYLIALVTVFLSANIASDSVTVLIDLMLQCIQTANIYALWKLHPYALRVFQDYREQRRKGIEDPVFDGRGFENVDGVTCWKPRPDIPPDNVRGPGPG